MYIYIYLFKLQFRYIFEKFNNTGYCGYTAATTRTLLEEEQKEICTKCIEGFYDCDVKYDVLIHNSRETLINDLDTEPIVTMKMGEAIFAEISKSNLDSIATEKNPCIYEEEKKTRTECLLNKVYIKQLLV